MKVEVKNVKSSEFASHETMCFEATLYVDGTRVGRVWNDGQGGCHCYYWDDAELGKSFKWAEKQDADFEKVDQIIDELIRDSLENKRLKGWCRKSTVFRLKGDENGSYRKVNAPYDKLTKDWLKKEYGDRVEEIVNERFVA